MDEYRKDEEVYLDSTPLKIMLLLSETMGISDIKTMVFFLWKLRKIKSPKAS
jgi:hypothetical protein